MEKVQALIEEKISNAMGLLSEDGAVRLVAEELMEGPLPQEPPPELRMDIGRLTAGLNDVTITAQVVSGEAEKEFTKQDGTTGRLVKLVLSDKTGQVSCANWDTKADEVSKYGNLVGRTITIKHGYTRPGLNDAVELHTGERSEIIVSDKPETLDRTIFKPIGSIKEPTLGVNVIGVVHSQPRLYQFGKEGKEGTVLRTRIADDTGSIPLVAWNEKAEELKDLKQDDIVQVRNGKLRRNNFGHREIHVDGRAKVTILQNPPAGFTPPTRQNVKISEIKSTASTVSMIACVAGMMAPQEVKRKTGESVLVSKVLLGDETGMVSASLWDERAKLVSQLKIGDILKIEDAVPTERFGQITISIGKNATVQHMTDPQTPPITVKVSKIKEITSLSAIVAIEGEIIEEPQTREVMVGGGTKVQVTSTKIRDETGDARISFWRAHSSEASKLRIGARIRIYGLSQRPGLSGENEFNTIQSSNLEVLTNANAGTAPTEETQLLEKTENAGTEA